MTPHRMTAGLAQPGDQDQILELNRREYGVNDILATPADFDWRFSQNPAGQAIVPVIRNDQGDVVGFLWVVPLRMRVRRQNYLAATGTNLVIQPEYRNTFAYAKLLRRFEQVFRDHGIPFHFSFISESAYRRRLKHNPQRVMTIPLLVKPLDFKGFARAYANKKWQRFLVGRGGQLVSPVLFRRRKASFSKEHIMVEAVDHFDHRFDKFWTDSQNKYPIMVIRDRAFLEWRFTKLSGRHYHLLLAHARQQMLGYIVLRSTFIRGVKVGLVMDLLVRADERGPVAGACLLDEAETYFRTQQVSLMMGLMTSFSEEYSILFRVGYRQLPHFITPRVFRFAFYNHGEGEHNVSLATQDWFVTLADYESF
ncbi:MAG: GNAT family N-acetyltransferase [Anaerolineae bacterium]|nr:GNAT family N-acetyltransferase [Anaerolineae bacterium]